MFFMRSLNEIKPGGCCQEEPRHQWEAIFPAMLLPELVSQLKNPSSFCTPPLVTGERGTERKQSTSLALSPGSHSYSANRGC